MKYETTTHDLQLAGQTIKITHITNFDDLLNALIEKGEDHEDYQDDRLPYWADLWHAAIGLAQYLVEEKAVKPGDSVLEIGCGLGLPGIMAGKLGGQVTLTDYLTEAVDFCKQNWEQNNKAPAKFELLDWRKPDPTLAADILLASDVAYQLRSFDALIETIDSMVPPNGRVILSEPNREIAKPFLERLHQKKGFEVQSANIIVNWDGFDKKVNVVDMKRLEVG